MDDQVLKRVKELQKAQGLDFRHALRKTLLEQRINAFWPDEWEDELHVLIYGDFQPPCEDISLPELRIVINHKIKEKEENIACSAMCSLEASVKIDNQNIPAIIDAIRRLNLFLGVWNLVEHGNGAFGWWSKFTHNRSGGMVANLENGGLDPIIHRFLLLPDPIRRKVNAALYWFREPRNLLMDSYRSDLLRIYSAHWNAFECLVDAVNEFKPAPKLSPSEKQIQIDKLYEERGEKITSEFIVECYNDIVNPGFKGKAIHALTVCFPKDADQYIYECFKKPEKRDGQRNSLYSIRNAIDHGDIDAENPEELMRIESLQARLHEIVWKMFNQLISIT